MPTRRIRALPAAATHHLPTPRQTTCSHPDAPLVQLLAARLFPRRLDAGCIRGMLALFRGPAAAAGGGAAAAVAALLRVIVIVWKKATASGIKCDCPVMLCARRGGEVAGAAMRGGSQPSGRFRKCTTAPAPHPAPRRRQAQRAMHPTAGCKLALTRPQGAPTCGFNLLFTIPLGAAAARRLHRRQHIAAARDAGRKAGGRPAHQALRQTRREVVGWRGGRLREGRLGGGL